MQHTHTSKKNTEKKTVYPERKNKFVNIMNKFN